MEILAPPFEADFRREHGAHDFTLRSGQAVSVISEPTWESFLTTLAETKFPKNSIVLTPELITAPYPPSQIEANTTEICNRIIHIQNLSALRPDVTILLGTPTFNKFGEKPRNSLVFVNNSVRFGQVDKRAFGQFGMGYMQRSENKDATLIPGTNLATLVCADLILAARRNKGVAEPSFIQIPESAEALLVSSCWAVPLLDREEPQSDDRYLAPLISQTTKIFEAYPNLQEIVMADRTTGASGLDAPFNMHVVRPTG